MRYLVFVLLCTLACCGPENTDRHGRAICQPSARDLGVFDTALCGKLCNRAFMQEASAGDIEAEVASGARADVHAGKELDSITAMHMAVVTDNLEAVRALIALGAELEGLSAGTYAPMHFVALGSRGDRPNRAAIASALLDAGARIDPVTSNCETPLYLAIPGSYGLQDPNRYPLIRLLVERGARKGRLGPRHRTPYDSYSRSSQPDPEILQLLK